MLLVLAVFIFKFHYIYIAFFVVKENHLFDVLCLLNLDFFFFVLLPFKHQMADKWPQFSFLCV